MWLLQLKYIYIEGGIKLIRSGIYGGDSGGN